MKLAALWLRLDLQVKQSHVLEGRTLTQAEKGNLLNSGMVVSD